MDVSVHRNHAVVVVFAKKPGRSWLKSSIGARANRKPGFDIIRALRYNAI